MAKQYWLMKSEPSCFSIQDLKNRPDSTEPWDGVRNYQARNFMRDDMKSGDLVLFYHSNCEPPGVVGVAEIVKEGYPDHTALNENSDHFDPKSSPENPRWYMVDVKWKEDFERLVPLKDIRNRPELKDMKLIQKGQRLSVQPVTQTEFEVICDMGRA
ncbi:MAG: EVE domain-containing protein [Spirochaetota bacterium]|nr:EVE domain-containing protein [Spirochaetota bacterium]